MKTPASRIALASAGTLFFAGSSLAGTVTTDGADILIKTKSGLEVKTTDGDYSFKIGGRIMLDASTYDGVVNADSNDWGEDIWFRRARIEATGKALDWSYKMSYNLTDSGSIDLMYISYDGWGKMAKLVMGQQKEALGMDDTGSSKWITFVSRALPANAFETANNVGLKLTGANDALTYSIGVYKESIDADDNSLDEAFTGRFVYRPLFSDDGDLVHLGAGYTFRNGEFESFDSRAARGGQNKSANKIGAFYTEGFAEEATAWNLEAAAQFGSFHMMAEYFEGEATDHPTAGDLEADGFYVQAGYFLTGEKRSYKTGIAAFDKVKPQSRRGAWEVALRYDELDVTNDDPLIETVGDVGNTYTIGVNWYVSPLVKLMANYAYVEVDEEIDGEDDGNVFALRAQYAY
jgi:phosphate-selective porin OprO/OprP